jgi:BolA protein
MKSNTPSASRSDRLAARLQAALQPAHLEIVDNSHLHEGHAGAKDGRGHFTVNIISERFTGMPVVRRHRLVYEAVGDLMQTDIHALSIKALAPGEGALS